MDFSKDFKTVWWAILVICIGAYLWTRYDSLNTGNANWFDAIVFLIFISIAIGPFFKEMEIFGLKLKQDMKELKEHVEKEFASLKSEVHNVTENRQSMNPHFTIGYPAPQDSQLNDIQEQIKNTIHTAMETYGIQSTSTTAIPEEALSNDINYLFVARYNSTTLK